MVADNPNVPIPKNPHRILALALPKEPPIGLLMSMALRLDHALGCPGYYDQEFLAMPGVSHARRVEVALENMRKLYEEVTGQGFYRPEIEDKYAALVPNG